MHAAKDDARLPDDYRLGDVLAEDAHTRVWRAEQVSMGREVRLVEWRSGDPSARAHFLAGARAKAAVDHPQVAAVFEAVDQPDRCWFAIEALPGETFASRADDGRPFEPRELAEHLGRVAEIQCQLEQREVATEPLSLAAIHLDDHRVVRLDNLAVAGRRAPEESIRDVCHLGAVLGRLIAGGRPGATRFQTLLAWMRGEGLAEPLAWERVGRYCQEILSQLGETATPTEAPPPARPRRKGAWIAAGAAVLGLAAVFGLAFLNRGGPARPEIPPPPPLPDPVFVEAGVYPTPDGTRAELPAFRIAAHEATIGEYAGFLDTLGRLAEEGRERAFDHRSQPEEKSGHVPDDWQSLLAAAESRGEWNGRIVALDSPVVGVDWWDAAAFATWKRARLPTQEEWFAAVQAGGLPRPEPGDWLPVSGSRDVTPNGLIGMAGAVAEWTASRAASPENPLGERRWVVAGGSYLRPGQGTSQREWTADRSLRRPDLGFRLVFPSE